MRLNSKIIVSDTSCLILLLKIDEIDILKGISNTIFVTSIIKDELKLVLPSWIQILDPKDKHYQSILEMDLFLDYQYPFTLWQLYFYSPGFWFVKHRSGSSSNRWALMQKPRITSASASRISNYLFILFAAFARQSPV